MKVEEFYLIPVPVSLKDRLFESFPELAKEFYHRKPRRPYLTDLTERIRPYQKNDEPIDETLDRILSEWKSGKKRLPDNQAIGQVKT